MLKYLLSLFSVDPRGGSRNRQHPHLYAGFGHHPPRAVRRGHEHGHQTGGGGRGGGVRHGRQDPRPHQGDPSDAGRSDRRLRGGGADDQPLRAEGAGTAALGGPADGGRRASPESPPWSGARYATACSGRGPARCSWSSSPSQPPSARDSTSRRPSAAAWWTSAGARPTSRSSRFRGSPPELRCEPRVTCSPRGIIEHLRAGPRTARRRADG